MSDRDAAPAPVSVVVPVYNSAAYLGTLAEHIDAALAGTDYELIFVNDGSSDESWARISDLAQSRPQITGLNLSRNYGQHNALLAGIRAAKNGVVVTLDDDGQNPPREIPALLGRLCDGVDLVYGTPRDPQHGLWRNAGTRLTKLVLRPVMGGTIGHKVTPFRAFRRELVEAFAEFEAPFVSIDALLNWATTRVASVEVDHISREHGRSSYSLPKLAGYALTLLTGFSTRPLRFASFIGFASTLLGLGLLVFVIVRYATAGTAVPGFAFLACMIALFSGAQLLTLGIIGEYLARVHERTMNRPAYVVRERAGLASAEADGLGHPPELPR